MGVDVTYFDKSDGCATLEIKGIYSINKLYFRDVFNFMKGKNEVKWKLVK